MQHHSTQSPPSNQSLLTRHQVTDSLVSMAGCTTFTQEIGTCLCSLRQFSSQELKPARVSSAYLADRYGWMPLRSRHIWRQQEKSDNSIFRSTSVTVWYDPFVAGCVAKIRILSSNGTNCHPNFNCVAQKATLFPSQSSAILHVTIPSRSLVWPMIPVIVLVPGPGVS